MDNAWQVRYRVRAVQGSSEGARAVKAAAAATRDDDSEHTGTGQGSGSLVTEVDH